MSDDATPDGATPENAQPHLTDTEQAEHITRFWDVARPSAGRTSHGGAVGERAENVVPPPVWAFGDNPELADELLALVLDGTKTATASLAVEFEDVAEQVPRKGDLSILLDGNGDPRALISTTGVEIVPFDEVSAEHARLEGEGDLTLESWRAEHESFWRRSLAGSGHEFDPSLAVVCEQFKVLYSE